MGPSEDGSGEEQWRETTIRISRDGDLIEEGAEPAEEGEWDVTLGFEEEAEFPSRMEIRPSWLTEGTFEARITARLLHAIKLGALVDEFNRRERANLAFQELFFGRRQPRRPRPPRPTGRAGPKGWGEEFYQDVARAYLEALQSDPRRPIERVLRRYPGYTPANVRDWVAVARRKGYLTRTTQGRPGGQPTEKLLEALRRRG